MSSAQKKIDALEKERQRIENLKKYEKEYAQYTYICGIDEVGRGPLAGPVVAGAVILPKDCDILYINDSKQLSEKKREELYDVITKEAVAWAVGYASPERIDEINILQATYEAMREAVGKLDPVSYTHLDVYKRQGVCFSVFWLKPEWSKTIWKICCRSALSLPPTG